MDLPCSSRGWRLLRRRGAGPGRCAQSRAPKLPVEYRDALELAKAHPGAVVTRGADGSFVVLDNSGQPLTADSSPSADQKAWLVKTENDRLQARISALNSQIDETQRRHRAEIGDLELRNYRLQAAQVEHENRIRLLEAEIQGLTAKASKVSAAEWERIRAVEAEEQAKHHQEMREKRMTIKCACLGEVENCRRCYGSGSYIVDGYGNPV